MSQPLWLTHHPPEEAERCASVAGRAVCRRCLAAWPLAFGVIAAGLIAPLPRAGLAELAAWWALPLAEYVAVHARGVAYHPGRTWGLGAMLGVALGRTLHRYLLDPTDPGTWAVLGLAALIGGLAAASYHRRLKNDDVL